MFIAGEYKLLQYYDNKKGAVEKSTAPYILWESLRFTECRLLILTANVFVNMSRLLVYSQGKVQKYRNAQYNSVPAKYLEVVALNVFKQKFNNYYRY